MLSENKQSEIKIKSKAKLDYLQTEYWRMRNGKQDYMRCPYCVPGRHGRRRNHEGRNLCCSLFAKAFGAILERQNQVDIAAAHVRNCHNAGLVH